MIGILLVTIAIILAVETKSLLLGEAAAALDLAKIERAITGGNEVERIIHMKTLHLGPDELLVAAKIAVRPQATAEDLARGIDAVEERIRAAVPIARAIYLEPDIYSATATAQGAGAAAGTGATSEADPVGAPAPTGGGDASDGTAGRNDSIERRGG
jgi:divalent metal cation (Fe/Co/Zn/Cd) transporter